ncbi:MAG TPA: hypothetical protein PK677_10160 [Acidiphilium sp.]|nr:hypothetical protein [Acidiphilium sp.]HQU24968.1 hypothetical protein [Acidiphilium sp.]
MRKQRAFHPELTLDDYGTVADLLDHPDFAFSDRDHYALALHVGQKFYLP